MLTCRLGNAVPESSTTKGCEPHRRVGALDCKLGLFTVRGIRTMLNKDADVDVRHVLPLVACFLLAFSTVVDGKGRVDARLTAAPPASAPPGTQVVVAWTLLDSDGLPFNSEGVFIRLFSGARESTIAFASGGPHLSGDYDALVRVPEDGIAPIEIGLRGIRSGSNGACTDPIDPRAAEAGTAVLPPLPAPAPPPVPGNGSDIATGIAIGAGLLGGAILMGGWSTPPIVASGSSIPRASRPWPSRDCSEDLSAPTCHLDDSNRAGEPSTFESMMDRPQPESGQGGFVSDQHRSTHHCGRDRTRKRDGTNPGRLHPRPLAAPEQLGPLGRGLRGGWLYDREAGVAG